MPVTTIIARDDPTLEKRIHRLEAKLQAEPNNLHLVTKLLSFLDWQAPKNTGRSPYSQCQRALSAYFTETNFGNTELTESFLLADLSNWISILNQFSTNRSAVMTQIFQGNHFKIREVSADCTLYLNMFEKTEAIHNVCHSCFKVQILPKSIFSLVMLYITMIKIKFDRNNQRKCMVELREYVKFPYKGYVYCESEAEAEYCLDLIRTEMKNSGIDDVFYGISHGCSEYGLKYPSFKYSADGSHRSFQRPEAWDLIEDDFISKALPQSLGIDDQSNEVLTIRDLFCFETWFKYAEIIGDESYRKFQIETIPNKMKRFTDRISSQSYSRSLELSELDARLHSIH